MFLELSHKRGTKPMVVVGNGHPMNSNFHLIKNTTSQPQSVYLNFVSSPAGSQYCEGGETYITPSLCAVGDFIYHTIGRLETNWYFSVAFNNVNGQTVRVKLDAQFFDGYWEHDWDRVQPTTFSRNPFQILATDVNPFTINWAGSVWDSVKNMAIHAK